MPGQQQRRRDHPTILHALLDAMGCQTAIAEQILARGADYLLVLKANHPLGYEAVVKHFDQACFRRGAPQRAAWDTFDEAHGRFVRRRVFASTEAASLEALRTWPNLHTVLAVESLRSTNGTPKVETEIRYFLSSCRDDPIVLGRAIRQHWAIENAVHWVLDVTFREDDSRVRDQCAARNLAVLRRMAINLVGRDGSTKASVRARCGPGGKGPPGTTTTCSSFWRGRSSARRSRGDA